MTTNRMARSATWSRLRKPLLVVCCVLYVLVGARIGYGGVHQFRACLDERWHFVTAATLLWPLWWPAAALAGPPEGITPATDPCTI